MNQLLTLQASPVAAREPGSNAKPHILTGLAIVSLLFGGLFGWAVTAKISGAVIASGKVVVESNRKSVEHLEGGIVGQILVREGDAVQAGQLLLRLDDTIERTNLAVIVDQQHELQARHARLRAEVKGVQTIEFHDELLAHAEEPKLRDILRDQQDLFAARGAARQGEREILEQRINNFRDQIGGLEQQAAARSRQMKLIRQELAGVEKLHKKGYAPLTRVLELKRELNRIAAQRAEHTTDIARASNSITEVELQILQAGQEFLETATEEIRDAQARIVNLAERRVAAEARLARLDVAAPQTGVVLGLTAHTIGGVIIAGEPIMEIVPAGDELVLEAQILPQDVDKVRAGLRSKIRLSAFDQQVTPEITGTLEGISADSFDDPRRDLSYFTARIRIEDEESARLGDLELVPGMPAEVFIETGERLAISYLMKPLLDSFARTFKDG